VAVRTGLRPRRAWVAAITLVAIGLTGCVATPATPTPPASPASPQETLSFVMSIPTDSGADASPIGTTLPVSCQPTDQDQYVYNPDRLIVVTAGASSSATS
jgi:hypothetical protein